MFGIVALVASFIDMVGIIYISNIENDGPFLQATYTFIEIAGHVDFDSLLH